MKTYVRDALTGLTAIAGVLGLATMLMLFGELRGLTDKFYTFNLHLDSARGLLSGGPVTLNGVRSGEIIEVRNADDPTRGVDLTLKVRDGVKIPAAFDVHIDRSLIGDASLELTPVADPALAGKFISAGDNVQRKAFTFMDDVAGQLADPIAAIKLTAKNLDTLTATYDQVGRRVNDLLEPRTPADVAAGRAPNVTSTIARIDGVVANADLWLGDSEFRSDARGLAKQASGVLSDASEAVKDWRKAAESVDQQVGRAGDNLASSSTRLNDTLATLGATADEIRLSAHTLNSGQGTLGMLLVNPDLYRSLQAASERLERALTEAQLLIEKYRKEGVPIQF